MLSLVTLAAGQVIFLLSYISTANSFPKPLTKKEESEYLTKFKNGDEEAKNILIEKNLRLVAHIAKKYASASYDTDDLISIGTIGLIKAVNTFNDSKGIRLATYAARCIDNEILMLIRNNKKLSNEVSLEEPIGYDKEGNEINLYDVVGTDDVDVVETVEVKNKIKDMYEFIETVLTKREKMVICMRYGVCGYVAETQREIAAKLDISRSYVSRIEKKALSKLEKAFEKKNNSLQD